MRYQYRYTKDEKRQLTALDRVLDDPTAPPREVNKAIQLIQRIQDAAESRAFDSAITRPEPAEPTVDALVLELEAKKQPHSTDSDALEPAVAPTIQSNVPEVTQNALEAVQAIADGKKPQPVLERTDAFCAFCSSIGNWNTRYPLDETAAKRVLLCPTCYGRMLSADMAAAQAEARHRAEQPADWAADFSAQRNLYSSDFEKSRAIWAEQDRQAADQQVQDRQERDRAEAEYHRRRADFLAHGGRL